MPPTPPGGHPPWGVYRLWRDAGYAAGALIGGITAASGPARLGVHDRNPSPACRAITSPVILGSAQAGAC